MSLRPGLALAQFAAHCPAYPRGVIGCARAPGTRLAGPAIPDPDGRAAVDMAFTPGGKTAYLLNSDEVIPLRTATNTLGAPIPVQGNNEAIAMLPARRACCR